MVAWELNRSRGYLYICAISSLGIYSALEMMISDLWKVSEKYVGEKYLCKKNEIAK